MAGLAPQPAKAPILPVVWQAVGSDALDLYLGHGQSPIILDIA